MQTFTKMLPLLAMCLLQLVGGRDLMSPASAPAAAASKADLSFVLTADSAKLKEGMLKLKDTAMTVTYLEGSRIKFMGTGVFTNGSLGSPLLSSTGKWLDMPQAVLYGFNSAGNLSSIALSLEDAQYDAEDHAAKFHVMALTPDTEDVKLLGGPVDAAIKDSKQGTGPKLLSSIPDTEQEWTAVTLVVESSRTALHQTGDTKDYGRGGYGNNGWNGGGNNGWNGNNNGWNNGYNNGWRGNNGWNNGWNGGGFGIYFG